MSRFFAPISMDDLKSKIDKFLEDEDESFPHNLLEKLGNDIKVKFDCENVAISENDFGPKELIGYKTLNGMNFFGMAAGGDWEHPVFFLVYFDGKKLRGYVPTDGNPWNTTTKEAYGNDEEADGKNAKKRWPNTYDGSPVEGDDFSFNIEELKKDITERILPLDGKTKESAKDIIESLTFYSTGDEAYELFTETCHFAYSLTGLGDDKKALIVAKWAKEMAEDSLHWAKENGDDLSDTAKGYWG